jgi:osmotically-inducible protein OsmY
MLRTRVPLVKTDEEIQKAIKNAFLYDPRVSSFDITIDVDNRVVTLTGVVDNLKAKKVAEQHAQETLGVARVKDYITVRPQNPPRDVDLDQNVRDALRRDPVIDRHEVIVYVLNNKVYLSGSVDTYYEKRHAADVTSRVAGVVDVQNSLAVSYEASHEWMGKTDQEIQEDIESELFWSLFVDSEDIAVTVNNGEAILTGKVDNRNELDAAIENAFEGGAKSVQSYLKIKDTPGNYPVYYDRSGYYSYQPYPPHYYW